MLSSKKNKARTKIKAGHFNSAGNWRKYHITNIYTNMVLCERLTDLYLIKAAYYYYQQVGQFYLP